MISIAIPVYDMKNKEFFLNRCLNSIREQSYQDFEIVITETGKGMAGNTNEAIKKSHGDLIKILYMDDYLAHKNSLKEIVNNFKKDTQWLVTGCEHDDGTSRHLRPHYAEYNDKIHEGFNTIGSPSVLTIRKGLEMYFDENMTWLLDGDLYKRLYMRYGEPVIIDDINVVIGLHDGQVTNLLTDKEKESEEDYINKKYK